ncbi:MAG TPA: hypothetical protein VGM77_02630 [Gemmatimonadales bacterium]|jgi:hypothetical protein
MFRSILAVLAGFISMVLVVVVGTAVAMRRLLRRGGPSLNAGMPAAYLVVNLGVSGIAALVGGLITARIATHAPVAHGLALGVLMALMSIASMRQAGATQPRWYQLVLATVMPLLAVTGAMLDGVLGAAG